MTKKEKGITDNVARRLQKKYPRLYRNIGSKQVKKVLNGVLPEIFARKKITVQKLFMHSKYKIKDFKIGERVTLLNQKEVTMTVIEIDKKHGRIICQLQSKRKNYVNNFAPEELEKESKTSSR